MNKNPKIVLCIGIIIFVLIGLFPPWIAPNPTILHGSSQVGYHFFFYTTIKGITNTTFRINYPLLLIQWMMIAVVTGGVIVLLKDKKTN